MTLSRTAACMLAPLILGMLSCERSVAGGSVSGAEVFAAACSRCHGPSGKPDLGMVAKLGVKDLTEPALQDRLADQEIRSQILRGSKNKQMPSFDGALTDAQVDAVIVYVRTLRSR